MSGDDPDGGFVVAGECLEPVDGSKALGVRPVGDESFPNAHVAVHGSSGAASWGATREDAIERVCQDADQVETSDRTGAIVETPGVLGGAPRVAGSRIGVLHVVAAHDDSGSIVETAAGFSGPLTVDEARAALGWADAHPAELQRLREERAQVIERIKLDWEPIEVSDDPEVEAYRRPDSNAFALFGPDEEEP